MRPAPPPPWDESRAEGMKPDARPRRRESAPAWDGARQWWCAPAGTRPPAPAGIRRAKLRPARARAGSPRMPTRWARRFRGRPRRGSRARHRPQDFLAAIRQSQRLSWLASLTEDEVETRNRNSPHFSSFDFRVSNFGLFRLRKDTGAVPRAAGFSNAGAPRAIGPDSGAHILRSGG